MGDPTCSAAGAVTRRRSSGLEGTKQVRDRTRRVDCPSCEQPMQLGALVLHTPWNPVIRHTVRWQTTIPKWRVRPPQESKVVLESTGRGRKPRLAHRCPACATVVVPPDEEYDGGTA